MVRVRDAPQCAICEFVMKEIEDTLEDETTEVTHTLTLSHTHTHTHTPTLQTWRLSSHRCSGPFHPNTPGFGSPCSCPRRT